MDLMFKPIPGFPNYSVSRAGIVLGQRGQQLKLDKTKGGYLRFRPCIDGAMSMMSVHRAVLLSWVGPPPDDLRRFACHRDGDPLHNSVENLYWGSYLDNWKDRKVHGNDGRGSKNGRAKMTFERAQELRALYATGQYTYHKLAQVFGISQAQANKIGRGLYWPTET